MLEILKNIHPIILDAIVISVFVLIFFFGIIRGMKKVGIDCLIFIASFFLSFTSVTDSVKQVLAIEVLSLTKFLPAGSSSALKFGVSTLQNLVASIALFLLFYIVIHVTRIAVCMAIFKGKKTDAEIKKSKVGRFFGGVISLAYQGMVLIAVMLILNTNIIGMNESTQKSTVTKAIYNTSINLTNKSDKDMSDLITLKILKGDVFYVVGDDFIDSYQYISNKADEILNDSDYLEVLNEGALTNAQIEQLVAERLQDLSNVAVFVNELDKFNVCKSSFGVFSEKVISSMNRAVLLKGMSKIPIDVNEYVVIKEKLAKAGVKDSVIVLLDEIIEGK